MCPALPRLGLCPRCFVFVIPLLLTMGPHQRHHPAHLTEVGPEAQRAEETYPGQGGNMDGPSPGVRPQSPAPSPVWEPQPCLEKASPGGVQQLLSCVSGQEGHSGAQWGYGLTPGLTLLPLGLSCAPETWCGVGRRGGVGVAWARGPGLSWPAGHPALPAVLLLSGQSLECCHGHPPWEHTRPLACHGHTQLAAGSAGGQLGSVRPLTRCPLSLECSSLSH